MQGRVKGEIWDECVIPRKNEDLARLRLLMTELMLGHESRSFNWRRRAWIVMRMIGECEGIVCAGGEQLLLSKVRQARLRLIHIHSFRSCCMMETMRHQVGNLPVILQRNVMEFGMRIGCSTIWTCYFPREIWRVSKLQSALWRSSIDGRQIGRIDREDMLKAREPALGCSARLNIFF